MISIFTEAAHALFYTTGGACCGFFLAALCHAAGNDSDDRRLTQRQAEIAKWAASLAAREGRLARAERLYFERTGHRVDEAAGKE